MSQSGAERERSSPHPESRGDPESIVIGLTTPRPESGHELDLADRDGASTPRLNWSLVRRDIVIWLFVTLVIAGVLYPLARYL